MEWGFSGGSRFGASRLLAEHVGQIQRLHTKNELLLHLRVLRLKVARLITHRGELDRRAVGARLARVMVARPDLGLRLAGVQR